MGEIDEARVRNALLSAKIQSFSSELVALQSCRDDTELYTLLARAMEGEPFLLSRMVRVANSVAFSGIGAGYAVGENECLLRIGLSMGKQIAEDFMIDQALGRIARASRFSRAVWREARLGAAMTRFFEEKCEPPFDYGGPFLPAILSYLGELCIVGLATAEYELPKLEILAEPGVSKMDVVAMARLALTQLELPKPVEDAIAAIPAVITGEAVPYVKSAAAVLLCRALVKTTQSGQSYSANVSESVIGAACEVLSMSEEDFQELIGRARKVVLQS